MAQNINIIVTKKEKTPRGPVIRLAVAPSKVTVKTAGNNVGEIQFNPKDNEGIVSLGKQDKVSPEMIRRAGGALSKWIYKNELDEMSIDISSFPEEIGHLDSSVEALAEGLILGAFRFEKYKSTSKKNAFSVNLLVDKKLKKSQAVVDKAVIIAEAVNLSREWAHEPPNVINPISLEKRAEKLAAKVGLKFRVLTDKQLEKMGAGAIVAVGKGSATPSRLIILEYSGKSKSKPVVLVGKSITFDTGGYSIKTTEGLVGMKYDKSGGMSVLATLVAAAKLGLKTPVVGVIAAAENMVSGNAYRPNDIIKALNGKTIEVISSDAEGRLVLCDALVYAQNNFEPRALIDIATLTGGVVVALGSVRAGLMSNNDKLADSLAASGEKTFERLWRLPLDDEYFDLIKGDDSDMKNSGSRKAHPIIGGIFLKQFVDVKIPWAHIDIAGVSDIEKDEPYCPKGATGFGVRLFLDYLENMK